MFAGVVAIEGDRLLCRWLTTLASFTGLSFVESGHSRVAQRTTLVCAIALSNESGICSEWARSRRRQDTPGHRSYERPHISQPQADEIWPAPGSVNAH